MASVSKRKWIHKGVEKEAWIVRYMDGVGSHRQKTFEKKKEADTFRRNVENELANGNHVASRDMMTVRAVCEGYLREAEDRVNDGRIGLCRHKNLKQAVDRSIIPFLGPKLFTQLKPSDIEDFYTAMIRTRCVKPSTAMDRIGVLKLIEDYAIRRGHVTGRVVPEGCKSLRGIKRGTIRTFSVEDMRAIFLALEERPPFKHARNFEMLKCMVYLAAICGLRYGEILALKVENVDFAQGLVRVRHSILATDVLKGPKTAAGLRTVGMPSQVMELVKAWLARYYIENDRGLIFRTKSGSMPSAGTFHNWDWHPLLNQAGLLQQKDNYHFHALRHFAASWRIEKGMSLTDVAADLGHETFDTTLQVYAHPVMGAQRRHLAVGNLADALLASERNAQIMRMDA